MPFVWKIILSWVTRESAKRHSVQKRTEMSYYLGCYAKSQVFIDSVWFEQCLDWNSAKFCGNVWVLTTASSLLVLLLTWRSLPRESFPGVQMSSWCSGAFRITIDRFSNQIARYSSGIYDDSNTFFLHIPYEYTRRMFYILEIAFLSNTLISQSTMYCLSPYSLKYPNS